MTTTVLRTEIMDIDSTDEEIEERMEELCRACDDASPTGQTFATCELTSAGYKIKVTGEPQV